MTQPVSDVCYAVIGLWGGDRQVWRSGLYDTTAEARDAWDGYCDEMKRHNVVVPAFVGFLEVTAPARTRPTARFLRT